MSNQSHTRTPIAKALAVNEDPSFYGAFAEIGAGQEVARHFFTAGKASQTIAKTMSAYDMVYSDEIYGKEASGRYVCESRLIKMLDKEFSLLVRRLGKARGEKSRFFAFANTVATTAQGTRAGGSPSSRQSHGWMGVRFQNRPGGEWNEIVIHVRALDRYRLLQQEAIGVLGVNLVHLAYLGLPNTKDIIPFLIDSIKPGQVAIDTLLVRGPDLKSVDNNLLNLELVRRGLAEAILFSPKREILDISDTFFDRALVIERGIFRPITNSHLEILDCGLKQFKRDFPNEKSPFVALEITMNPATDHRQFDESDYLDRVKMMTAAGHNVLVSQFFLFYRLKRFLRMYTKRTLGLLVGATLLNKMLDEEFYRDLEGGILEGLGKLFDQNTKVYVFPTQKSGTLSDFVPPKGMESLFHHLLNQGALKDIEAEPGKNKFVLSEQVHEMLMRGDSNWEKHVPLEVSRIIKSENLFAKV